MTAGERNAADMDRSIRELQQMVEEHEAALLELKKTARRPAVGGSAAASTKASLDIMKTAYDEVLQSKPFLPSTESVLPALLAIRKASNVITESRESSKAESTSLEVARKRLGAEKANLSDQKQLQSALETRLATLRSGSEAGTELTPLQIAKEKLHELKQQKQRYDKDTVALMKGLRKFFDDHLGAMLAAEELGGPVVGDLMDIDTDDLVAGFNTQGKLKKSKKEPDQDTRQRRINEIWGPVEVRAPAGQEKELDEAAAAGAEIQNLMEELLNEMRQAGGDSSAAYVKIPQDTAAARFLVRSKVAQFHPRDATRIRLVDFGRELDD